MKETMALNDNDHNGRVTTLQTLPWEVFPPFCVGGVGGDSETERRGGSGRGGGGGGRYGKQ